MPTAPKAAWSGITVLLLTMPALAHAQSLEPRLYVPLPISRNAVVVSYGYSSGNVVMDAALPISGFTMTLHSGAAAYVRTFGLAGRTGQVQVVVPFASGMARAVIAGQDTSRELQGPADPQLRIAVNLLGGPARRRQELAGVRFGTIVGASLTVTAPLGTYNTARLLNIGANRWSLKPEVGVVQPIGRRWALEGYGGVWLFGDNTAYADTATLAQDPLWALQAHLIRVLGRRGWVALDGIWVSGGTTSVNDVMQNTFQRSTRLGATAAWTVRGGHVLKGSFAKGVYTRYGGDFDVFSVGYQYNWGG